MVDPHPDAGPPVPSTAYLDHVTAETEERRARAQATEDAAAGDDGPGTAGGPGATPAVLVDAVDAAVDALGPDLDRIVQTLHAHPEVAFEEHRSAALLVDLVRSRGVDVTAGAHGVPTAFRAEIGGDGPGAAEVPTIGICAEYDALPRIGHACGHNIIAATGVGAFLALAQVLASPGAPQGRVVLLGTPAEEGHSGKEVMARAGAFDGLDAAIMVHPYGHDVADQVWLGRRLLTWTFTGRSAHASAQPFMGRNALDAANLAYSAIGLLRQQMPPSDRVHATVAEGGTRPSIITDRAVMHLYARSKYPDTLRDLSRRLDDVARGAALMTGTSVEITWDDGAHPSLPVRTNQALTRRWVASQRRRGRDVLPGGVVSETLAASTDFGNISFRVPGIHPLIAVSDPDVALHTPAFAEAAAGPRAGRAARDGAAGLAQVALDFLGDARLREAVAAEFAAQGGAVDVPGYFE